MSNGGEAEERCAVCMRRIKREVYAIFETPCGHVFHTACIKPWLDVNTDCPTCRQEARPMRGGPLCLADFGSRWAAVGALGRGVAAFLVFCGVSSHRAWECGMVVWRAFDLVVSFAVWVVGRGTVREVLLETISTLLIMPMAAVAALWCAVVVLLFGVGMTLLAALGMGILLFQALCAGAMYAALPYQYILLQRGS